MNRLLYSLLFVVSFIMAPAVEAEQVPHLILHFDVNKTLIASDKTEGKTIEDVINELLSKKYTARWDETVKEPITFENYVKTVILPGAEHNAKLKEERLVYLIHFIDYLRQHQHPLYQQVLDEYTLVLEALKRHDSNIFSSFYHLIFELNRKGISYTLFLRSFGKEVFEITNEINSTFQGMFKIQGTFRKGILHVNDKALSGVQSISDFFASKENAAIRDDWHYWMEGEMKAKCGKPLYIDPSDKSCLTIFFDDNIKMDSFDKNIIGPVDSKTGNSISIAQLLESRQMVSVNTLEAILNERYYLEYVEEALQIHQMR